MISSIKISGFKNFRNKSVELTSLKRINILVGINGSGKSSILELISAVSGLGKLNIHEGDILVNNIASNIFSLFEPSTEIKFSYDDPSEDYRLKIMTRPGDRWQVEKEGSPKGGQDVIAFFRKESTPFNDSNYSSNRQERPFGGIRPFEPHQHIVLPDILDANEFLLKVNPFQRDISTRSLSTGQFNFEGNNEVKLEYLAGGTRYIAGLMAGIRQMANSNPLLLIDDLGDELFPAVRKALIPKINELLESSSASEFAQMFATTHNIEIVSAALNNPEYCSVYMFDYDGALVEFKKNEQHKTNKSHGLDSKDAVPAVAKMLGITDLDLGFPEIVILSEEDTKRTFLNSLKTNKVLGKELINFEVQVPFQAGDGNVTTAINNLLDLSKFFFFSEVWSSRYVLYVDYNKTDYDEKGQVKANTNSTRLKALGAAQKSLGLNDHFLLTKTDVSYVGSIEETYPPKIWENFRKSRQISEESIVDWVKKDGKNKAELAEYVGKNITKTLFVKFYPELAHTLGLKVK